jgi:glycosyltransferase involved in cell wall biosynthesis
MSACVQLGVIGAVHRQEVRVDEPSRVDVTVVMPAHNRAHLIGRALESVRRQTLRPLSVVVVDDHSQDDTVRVARSAGATVLQTPQNQGSGPARNMGVRAAKTQWVAFLDSDDEWGADHLATLWSRRDGHVLVCTSGHTSTGGFMGNPQEKPMSLSPQLVLESSEIVCTSAVLARRDALVGAGLFRGLPRAQDLDMWLRLLEQGAGVALPDDTLTYHLHDQQVSKDAELTRQCVDQILADCHGRPWFDERRGADRVHARRHWDDLRSSQRRRNVTAAGQHAAWLLRRPHVWPALTDLLRARRLRRRRSLHQVRVA